MPNVQSSVPPTGQVLSNPDRSVPSLMPHAPTVFNIFMEFFIFMYWTVLRLFISVSHIHVFIFLFSSLAVYLSRWLFTNVNIVTQKLFSHMVWCLSPYIVLSCQMYLITPFCTIISYWILLFVCPLLQRDEAVGHVHIFKFDNLLYSWNVYIAPDDFIVTSVNRDYSYIVRGSIQIYLVHMFIYAYSYFSSVYVISSPF
jgi:hypothetical protein